METHEQAMNRREQMTEVIIEFMLSRSDELNEVFADLDEGAAIHCGIVDALTFIEDGEV